MTIVPVSSRRFENVSKYLYLNIVLPPTTPVTYRHKILVYAVSAVKIPAPHAKNINVPYLDAFLMFAACFVPSSLVH